MTAETETAVPTGTLMKGKRGLIMGLANDKSLAWGIAQKLREEGAELATAVLRYVCDQQQWSALSPRCGLAGAIDGIGGIEITIEQGDRGDPEVGLNDVDAGSFFYDPRSLRDDFSDARYMGIGKWLDLDAAIDLFPDKEQELKESVSSGYDLTSDPASDEKWITTEGGTKRLRLVDHWYIAKGQWRWCLYTGAVMLDQGESYLVDESGKSFCRYIMYSANVDQDGDRYGFWRMMKSAADEINMRRSKGLHLLNSRRMVIEDGTGLNVEEVRREAARPDGVIRYPAGTQPPEFDDNAKSAELTGQVNFLQDARAEIDNIEQIAVPPWRSGVKVVFPVRSGRAALLRIVLDNAQRLERIVSDVLELGRRESQRHLLQQRRDRCRRESDGCL